MDPGGSATPAKRSGTRENGARQGGAAGTAALNAAPAASAATTTDPGPASTAPRPDAVSRLARGAEESLDDEGPVYLPGGKVKAVFVHHTADTQTNYLGTAFTKGQSYTLKSLSAHRDGFDTECPGNRLYAQLDSIRTSGPAAQPKAATVDGAPSGRASTPRPTAS
ncbi:hypothetical protein [Streptomyces sp. NPDC059389]|uniref:hypothetical protein n=1 Tax=Streptomyces sp. NPDC059389 TaxID=3346818 RepID=UPI00369F54CD